MLVTHFWREGKIIRFHDNHGGFLFLSINEFSKTLKGEEREAYHNFNNRKMQKLFSKNSKKEEDKGKNNNSENC